MNHVHVCNRWWEQLQHRDRFVIVTSVIGKGKRKIWKLKPTHFPVTLIDGIRIKWSVAFNMDGIPRTKASVAQVKRMINNSHVQSNNWLHHNPKEKKLEALWWKKKGTRKMSKDFTVSIFVFFWSPLCELFVNTTQNSPRVISVLW